MSLKMRKRPIGCRLNAKIDRLEIEAEEKHKKEEEFNKLIAKLEDRLENKKERWDIGT